jgi:hypothetical protein
MMGYQYSYGFGPMASGGFGLLCLITWLVWTVVGILLAIWLWQKISHK